MTKVSVIVPVYLAESSLDKCVQSLLAQEWGDIEILLINDGSPDGCPEIMDKYASTHPNKIRVFHKENGGQGDARNYALSLMSGEYVCFVDSDDTVTTDYVSAMLMAAINTNADIVICDSLRVNIATGATQIQVAGDFNGANNASSNLTSSPDWLFRITAAPWGKLFRSTLFATKNPLRFPMGIIFEDLGLVPILLHRAKQITKINRVLYHYSIHQNSTIRANKRPGDTIKALEIVYNYYKEAAPGSFHHELSMLYIKHGIIYRYLHEWPPLNYIKHCVRVINALYPDWPQNPYLRTLPSQEVSQLMQIKYFGANLHYTKKILKYKIGRLFKTLAQILY